MHCGVAGWLRGYPEVPAAGEYTFFVTSDDGSKLLIGEDVVVDNDGAHNTEGRSETTSLRAGKHAIAVLFFEKAADGTGTRTVPVQNASSFCDGWGRVESDLIQVGDGAPVRLAADYEANVLTLERTVSFSEGAPVSLPWHGSAPDMGAFEFGQD